MDYNPEGKSFFHFNAIHPLFLGTGFELVRVRGYTLCLWISRFNAKASTGSSAVRT